jgi:uncharacterized protein (TIGR02118 family)
MKSICALAHRPDLDRETFQHYYEERHAPLGIRHFPFTRYVRNHLLDAPEIGFDTISEFWADDIAATAALMEGPIGETMRKDEERFMDRTRIAPGGAEEHVLSPGACASAAGERFAVLVRKLSGDGTAFRDAVLGWAREIAARAPGVSIDFVQSWREPSFPAEAVLWTPLMPEGVSAPFGHTRIVRVRRAETAPQDLLGWTGHQA